MASVAAGTAAAARCVAAGAAWDGFHSGIGDGGKGGDRSSRGSGSGSGGSGGGGSGGSGSGSGGGSGSVGGVRPRNRAGRFTARPGRVRPDGSAAPRTCAACGTDTTTQWRTGLRPTESLCNGKGGEGEWKRCRRRGRERLLATDQEGEREARGQVPSVEATWLTQLTAPRVVASGASFGTPLVLFCPQRVASASDGRGLTGGEPRWWACRRTGWPSPPRAHHYTVVARPARPQRCRGWWGVGGVAPRRSTSPPPAASSCLLGGSPAVGCPTLCPPRPRRAPGDAPPRAPSPSVTRRREARHRRRGQRQGRAERPWQRQWPARQQRHHRRCRPCRHRCRHCRCPPCGGGGAVGALPTQRGIPHRVDRRRCHCRRCSGRSSPALPVPEACGK